MTKLRELTQEEEQFATLAIQLGDLTKAWRAIHPKSRANSNTANKEAHKIAKRPAVAVRLEELRAVVKRSSEITVEGTLRALKRVMDADPRKLFRKDGSIVPVHELDDDTALAVAGVEHVALVGDKSDVATGYTRKVKFSDRNGAISMAMRHLGLYEKDNQQVQDNIRVEVVLVQPKPVALKAAA